MAVNIVTGMTGTAHITSDDDRCFNASVFGKDKYVFDYGQKFSANIINNNLVRIHDGMCISQGTQMGIELTDYEDIEIENGVSGANRNDLIVMRYERNADTSIENASLVVIKGTEGSTAEDPSYISGNILDGGDLIDDMPLFRVKIESLSITAVEPLFIVFDSSHRKALAGLSNVDNTSDLNKPVSIATQKVIDDIEIGGRNLFLNSGDLTKWTKENGVSVVKDSDGWFKIIDSQHSSSKWGIYFNLENYEQNADYTLSVDVKYGNAKIGIAQGFGGGRTNIREEIESGSKRIKMTFNTGSNTTPIEVYLYIYPTAVNQYGYFKLPKLEKGNKATDWTPAIEDTEAEIQSVDNKLTTNFLKPTFATTTRDGVTCTNNGDGTYTLNGTNNTDNTIWFELTGFFYLETNKKYKLVGCYPNGGEGLWFLELYNSKISLQYTRDYGDGKVFTNNETTVAAEIGIIKGATLNNFTFKPMLTTNLNATYDDFVPYTGSTGQINSDVAEIVNNLGDASYKGVSTSVTSGDSNLVTGGAVSSAISKAANYEEGEWTPTCNALSSLYSHQATYVKIGNIVYCNFEIGGARKKGQNVFGIGGLPYYAHTVEDKRAIGTMRCTTATSSTDDLLGFTDSTGTENEQVIDVYLHSTTMINGIFRKKHSSSYLPSYNSNSEVTINGTFIYQTTGIKNS